MPAFWAGLAFAQNMVGNGSFESFINIPNGSGQVTEAIGWKSSGGSPDYFHQAATVMSGVNIPFTFAGEISGAFEGTACAGICSYMDGWANYREYLSYKLDTNMIAGQWYEVSFYCLSNPTPLNYGGLSTDNFGAALSKQKLHKSSDGIIHYSAQCIETDPFYAFGWKKLSFQFLADSNYKFITIGCFADDSLQQRHTIATATLFQSVYTFIDNVSVKPVNGPSTTATEEIVFNKELPTTYTDILGRPASYRKGLLIAHQGKKSFKLFVQ